MRIIGHRGASGYAPENTLESFELAIRQGVSAIELDVHQCASGELVVIHDETFNRTTNGKGPVAKMTLDELKELDAGNGNQIPTLKEVFEIVARRVKINIEIKGRKVAGPLAEILSKFMFEGEWNPNYFYVSSFDHDQLKQFHSLIPRLRTGILYKNFPLDYKKLARKINAFSINLSVNFCKRDLIAKIHKNGFEVWVYTVNEPEDFERLKNWGADAVFTNYPERFLKK